MDNPLPILSKNKDTEIGKRWKFQGISSVEQFQQQVPLTTYDVYKPYIDRIAEHGEQNLLTNETVVQFAPSSGTTGKMKLIPVSDTIVKSLPGPSSVTERTLMLTSIPDVRSCTTLSGMPVQALSIGMLRHLLTSYPHNHVVPITAYDIDSIPVALYVQLVFGLKDTSTNVMLSSFIPVLVTALTELTLKWPQMLRDIETGKLDQSLPISPIQRVALEKLLGGPDQNRAENLRKIFNKHIQAIKSEYFKNCISAIWPNLRVIKCLCSGNMTCYIPTVRHYIGPNIHLLSYKYVCSEAGVIGLPARPLTETSLFRLVPDIIYEFIPRHNSHLDQPKTLLPCEVEVGEVYEIVMTTHTGFYRYRNGDYIKVIEQEESGPLIDFHGRMKITLHLREHILFEANIEEAMTALTKATASRVDYIVSVDQDTYSRYIIWLECDDVVSHDIDKELDESLQSVDETYKYDRERDKVDPLIVTQVKAGTFSEILAFMKSKTFSIEAQLKIPRVAVHDKISTILSQNAL